MKVIPQTCHSQWAYLMKVIPQTRHSHYITISSFLCFIPQTCHSHYISYLLFYLYVTMSVPDEGYSKCHSHYIICLRSYFYLTMSVLSSFLFVCYTWWRYMMKVIPQTRPQTCHSLYIIYLRFYFYFTTLAMMKVIPQTHYSHYIIYLRFYFYFNMSVPTWWRLFHKHVIHTTLAIFVSSCILQWAYLMTVIPQTRHSHYINYLHLYFYFTMSAPDEGYSRNMSFTLH